MYILNYVDRNALPQARVQGLEEDIGLDGVQYNIVLSLTFIGYILVSALGIRSIRAVQWFGGHTCANMRFADAR